MEPSNANEGEARVNEIKIHYVEAGEGPLVLCLHGFPETSHSWRHQLAGLDGFHVVAPDLRGYNLSDKPDGRAAYRLPALLDDITGLINYFGARPVTLVGHDWGGMLAWAVAMRRPEAISSLVVLNAPHPRAFSRGLRHPAQLFRSWYMALFLLPGLPEAVIRSRDFAIVERTLRLGPVDPAAFTSADIEAYKMALRPQGRVTAALNYYRGVGLDPRSKRMLFSDTIVRHPTLLIWGDRDRYLRKQLAEASMRWAPNLQIEHLGASHWVQNDVPDRVNQLILEFLRSGSHASPAHSEEF